MQHLAPPELVTMAKIYKHTSPELYASPRELLGIAPVGKVTQEVLENALLGQFVKKINIITGSLIAKENLWDEAMALARSTDSRVAFRASWALEWAYNLMPGEIESRWERFFEDFLASHSDSVHRVYSKMLCDMMRRNTAGNCPDFATPALSDDDAARLAEKCFDLLINPDTAVAVKVWQIEILLDLSPRMDWIGEHLHETVRTMSESPDCPPAMAAHARHYFRRSAMVNSKM